MATQIPSASHVAKPLAYERQGAEPLTGVFRDDKSLVLKRGADISPYCLCCGRPVSGKGIRKHLVSKTEGGRFAGGGGSDAGSGVIGLIWFVLCLIVLLVTLISAVIAWSESRERIVTFGLCERHRRRRIIQMTAAWILFSGGVITSVGGTYLGGHASPAMGSGVMICTIALSGGAILWLAAAGVAATLPSISLMKEQGDWLWVTGACEPLLQVQPPMLSPEPVDGLFRQKLPNELGLDTPTPDP